MVSSYSPKQILRLPAGLPRAGRKWTGSRWLAGSGTDNSEPETGPGGRGQGGSGQDSSGMGGSVPDSSCRREAAGKKTALVGWLVLYPDDGIWVRTMDEGMSVKWILVRITDSGPYNG